MLRRPLLRRIARGPAAALLGLSVLTGYPVAVLTAPADTSHPIADVDRPTLIVAVGAPGEDVYGSEFSAWRETLNQTAERSGAKAIFIGPAEDAPVPAREQVRQALSAEPKDGTADLWMVLIGHGTFDRKEAKLNLLGPDLSASDLDEWLAPFSRPVAVVVAASASSPFLNRLSATNRVIVTATRSGGEVSYARFGGYFSEALGSSEADLDKDGQTSLLEAFLMGARRVKEFYDLEGRLASEHALIDDTGDGRGTPAHWFQGIRAVKKAREATVVDGTRAHRFHLVRSEAERRMGPEARQQRDRLEMAIASLREEKPKLGTADYYQRLERLLLELARLYEAGARVPTPSRTPATEGL